jgi:radical S-adenosyl methionine domain-containing protein 2
MIVPNTISNLEIITQKANTKVEHSKFISVNLHITKACNYRCGFCYAHFNQLNEKTTLSEWIEILNQLKDHGCQKVTFVGGEPTLISYLPELVIHAKSLGLTTMIVTNGSKITSEYLESLQGKLDWMGISIDSGIEEVSKNLGRGTGNHVLQTIEVAKLLNEFGIKLKINTVVTKRTFQEDMRWLLQILNPKRWKVFQMLPIEGENDGSTDLLISDEEFNHFIETNKKCNPIPENNDTMTDSYVMIDPEGRFFNNSRGALFHGPKILEVGLVNAFKASNFDFNKFQTRKGLYDW